MTRVQIYWIIVTDDGRDWIVSTWYSCVQVAIIIWMKVIIRGKIISIGHVCPARTPYRNCTRMKHIEEFRAREPHEAPESWKLYEAHG